MSMALTARIWTLEEMVEKTSDLPSIPAATLAVMREAESPTGSAHSVARCLMQDQALTTRVLRLANSAFYGLSRQVVEIPEAVVVLGMRTIRNLCLLASTYPWMNKPLAGYDLPAGALWAHSFGVGVGAQLVAQRTGQQRADLAFTAGLLHNIGKVVINLWIDRKLAHLHALALEENLTFDEAERRVLGYDHAEVGAHLAEQWNLPKILVEAIRFHHAPNAADNRLVDSVHVADLLVTSLGIGTGGDGLRYEFAEESLERLGLTPADLDVLACELATAYDKHEKLFEEPAG
jgi:putative nucleotidyltransferase with HDIG domain